MLKQVQHDEVLWYNKNMNYKSFLDRPFRLMALIGCVYLIIMLILNVFTGFSYEQSIMPYSKAVSYIIEGIAFILCVLSFFFYTRHIIYYIALEILTLSNL